MRRRLREGVPPPELARFDPKDWPARGLRTSLDQWAATRRAWWDANGRPGGPLAMMAAIDDVRRTVEGQPLLSWGRTDDELQEAVHQLGEIAGRQAWARLYGARGRVAVIR